MAMHFMSDNAASVHPNVWSAMLAADAPDAPYDGDALSRRLDDAFSELFGRPCWALWVASGTAANCLALSTMVPPQGAAICHREAHIETSEGGAPGFYTHGAKLMLADGEGAKLSPETIGQVLDPIPDGVHWVKPAAISITQATELGRVYAPDEVLAIGLLARERVLWLQMDGGVSTETIERCADAGADVFVAGSAVYAAEDRDRAVRELRALAEKATSASDWGCAH